MFQRTGRPKWGPMPSDNLGTPKTAFYGRTLTGTVVVWLSEKPGLNARGANVKAAIAAFVRLPGVNPSREGANDGMYLRFEEANRVPAELERSTR